MLIYPISKIQFSNNVSNADKKKISQILQISVSNRIGTYFGCTNIDQKIRTKEDFDDIMRRLGQKQTG